jgi:predicted secreted protein
MTSHTITKKNNNAELNVHVGDKLIVRLEAIPGAGFSWSVIGDVGGVLSQSGEPVFERSGERLMGGVEQQVFTFQVKSKGVLKLQLEYRRPWEKAGAANKSFSIRVKAEGIEL